MDTRESIYKFGKFRLNVGQLMLYRGDAEIPLRPKAVETLVALVERCGEIVTKDELMRTIWSDAIVEESNLSRYIHILRSVLGVQSNGEPYIETYRRRGFRFSSEVSILCTSVASIEPGLDHEHSVEGRGAVRDGTTGNVIQLADWRRDIAETGTDKYSRSIFDETHNLPTPLTELIGRQAEVHELKALLQNEPVRLVTLTGTGGTGKTRLSLHVASELVGEFADGVFFVELAHVREPALIPSTIARTLKIQESGGEPLEDLKVSLRGRSILLVLDNFEQVLEASPLVAELLEACFKVKVLATSRAALHIRGEHEYAVQPLSLPSDDHLQAVDALQSAAVRLFVERASQANFRFVITDDNAPAIVEICRRLDGLPLAIELAALRIKTLTPEKILERLANRLQLLSGGARDLPARQQTMRHAIAWSYELLTEVEKTLFQRLSIFSSGFTLEAAQYVAGENEESPRRRSRKRVGASDEHITRTCLVVPSSQTGVFDGITSLTDKGLLVSEDDANGNPRFRMLEVVRELALETLEASDGASSVIRRHAEYYATLGQRAERHMRTSTAGPWLNTLACDHHNLRSAMGWLFENDPLRGAHLAAAIRVYLIVYSHLAEGRVWLETALNRNKDLPATVRFNLLNNLAWIILLRGDYEAARSAFEENLSEAKLSGDKAQIADSLRGLGEAAWPQRRYSAARQSFEKALAIYRELDNKLGIANTLLGLGAIVYFQGELAHSLTLSEEGLMIFRKTGYKSGLCTCLVNLGEFACRRKDYESARKFFAESFIIAEREGYRDRLSFCLNGLAALAAEQKQWKEAVQLAGAAEKLRETIGFRPSPQDDDFQAFYLEKSLSMLGPESHSAAYEEGRRMKLEAAIALAWGTYELRK